MAPLIFDPGDHEPSTQGYSDQRKANVRRAGFEGGYSQRSKAGPNSIGRSVPVTFEVPDAIKEYICDFLAARGGAEAFHYQLPWDTSAQLWTVSEWSSVPIGTQGAATFWRVSFVLNREFDII